MKNTHLVVLGLAAAATVGCGSDLAPALGPEAPRLSVESTTPLARADAQTVARGLALALGRGSVRMAVRDAMRASPMTEHKLELHEFLGTPAGEELHAAAAAALRISKDSLTRIVALLPALDFYMPSRDHRLSWRGTPNVHVSIALGPRRDEVIAYDTRGRGMRVMNGTSTPHPLHGLMPLLLLHPAEPKARRVDPQAAVPGETIQEPTDGEVSGRQIRFLPDGDSVVVEFADLARVSRHASSDPGTDDMCSPAECSDGDDPGSGGGGTAYRSFVGQVETRSVCDNDNCGEGNEFVWEGSYYTNGTTFHSTTGTWSGGTFIRRDRLEVFGFGCCTVRTVNGGVSTYSPGASNDYLQVKIYELDSSINPDDVFLWNGIYPQWLRTHAGTYRITTYSGGDVAFNVWW